MPNGPRSQHFRALPRCPLVRGGPCTRWRAGAPAWTTMAACVSPLDTVSLNEAPDTADDNCIFGPAQTPGALLLSPCGRELTALCEGPHVGFGVGVVSTDVPLVHTWRFVLSRCTCSPHMAIGLCGAAGTGEAWGYYPATSQLMTTGSVSKFGKKGRCPIYMRSLALAPAPRRRPRRLPPCNLHVTAMQPPCNRLQVPHEKAVLPGDGDGGSRDCGHVAPEAHLPDRHLGPRGDGSGPA